MALKVIIVIFLFKTLTFRENWFCSRLIIQKIHKSISLESFSLDCIGFCFFKSFKEMFLIYTCSKCRAALVVLRYPFIK